MSTNYEEQFRDGLHFLLYILACDVAGDSSGTVGLKGMKSNEAITMLVHVSPLSSVSSGQTRLQAMNEQLCYRPFLY